MATPAEVSGLQLCWLNTLAQIDCALDKRDKRAFLIWRKRYLSLTARIERLLVAIAMADTR